MTTAPAPVILRDDTLLEQAAQLIPASADETFCDARLPASPFLCSREPHTDEVHVAHDSSGRARAIWPILDYAIVRTVQP